MAETATLVEAIRILARGPFIVSLLWSGVHAYGSSLAVLDAGDSVILAADSKQLKLAAGGGTASACKITPLPSGVVFASVGVRSAFDKASGETTFEAHEVAAEACGATANVRDCADAFDALVRRHYADAILAGAFRRRAGPEPLELFTSVFAGFGDGGPQVVRMEWSALIRESPLLAGSGTMRGRAGTLPAGEMWVLGSGIAFERRADGTPEQNKLAYARRLIEAEIKANPDEVGPPIDVLRITEAGACWAVVKPECGEGLPMCEEEP